MSNPIRLAYDAAASLPGEPIPIKPKIAEASEFPIHALSGKLQAAVNAIVDKARVPPALAAQSVIATASLAVQAFANVTLPTGKSIPTSLYVVTVAGSSDRKSSGDELALAGIVRWEAEMLTKGARERIEYNADMTAYKAAQKKAQATTANRTRHDIKADLLACGDPPIAPPSPNILIDNITVEGIHKMMAEAQPTLGLFSTEGGVVLGGYAMQQDNRTATAAALSLLWDGAPVKRLRQSEGFTVLYGRRLSVHLMIQPRIARELFSDQEFLSQGILSRMLPCEPKSIRGERFWREPNEQSAHDLKSFEDRVYGLLNYPLPMDPETRELKPRSIPLSVDARVMWIAWHDVVEAGLKPDGEYDRISGFAGKLPEHAARIAGVMAYFENRKVEEISATAMAAGIEIARFYGREALRLFDGGTVDQFEENASLLIEWIRSTGHPVVGHRFLAQYAVPRSIRTAQMLARVLEILIEHGHLRLIHGGGTMTINGVETTFKKAYSVISDVEPAA